MKQDYLWDKTGENPEIERLENALKAFRYQEVAPPALPAKVIPFRKETPRNFFRLSFAFTACPAFVIIALGVWFQLSSKKIQVAKDSAETIAPQIDKKNPDEISIKKQNNLIVEKTEIPKQSAELKITKIRKAISPIFRQNKTIARNVEIKKPTVVLTKEEKYAYDQLMLALSIASSKLKLVTDKIDGIEKKPSLINTDDNFINQSL